MLFSGYALIGGPGLLHGKLTCRIDKTVQGRVVPVDTVEIVPGQLLTADLTAVQQAGQPG